MFDEENSTKTVHLLKRRSLSKTIEKARGFSQKIENAREHYVLKHTHALPTGKNPQPPHNARLNTLCRLVLEMGRLVYAQLHNTQESLINNDVALANKASEINKRVKHLELGSDGEILKVFAAQQLPSSDQRMASMALKIIGDLERITDETIRISGAAPQFYAHNNSDNPANSRIIQDLQRTGKLALENLRQAIDAFEFRDESKALQIISGRKEKDAEFSSTYRELLARLMEDHIDADYAVSVMLALNALGRIAHLAENFAEHVVLHLQADGAML